MRYLIFFLILGLAGVNLASKAWSEEMQMHNEETAEVNNDEIEDVGNKICPVSGEKIVEKTKATYEYKGKVYNFCCTMCLDEFKKNPEKYIKKAEEELSKSDGNKDDDKISKEKTPIKIKEDRHGELLHQ